ncbi:MAG TPA: shikimate dehydrogenase [Casimicrobiaceae bacterium]|nr:shikimate dehydrogenase [Casimicrobiaceae bacterium]
MPPPITGATRLYAIIGDPIAQVRSPEVFTARFADAGIDAVMIPVRIPVQHFDTIAPALLALGNLDGVLVTVPFKARMAPFATRVGHCAKTIGAVNALRREADGSWTGEMFDGVGFVRGVERKGGHIRGRRAALFGAGGAGSAIACALADAGAQAIDVIDTDSHKAIALVETLARGFPACAFAAWGAVRSGIDMIVNASPVGMRPEDGLPGDIGPLDAGTLVGDVVITPAPTALIRHAIQHGCTWADGRDMHGGQVETLLAFFAAASRDGATPSA